jgi:hypothetical protein
MALTDFQIDAKPGETVRLPSGRVVHWTGKVFIGLRNGQRQDSERVVARGGLVRDIGTEAERLQIALLRGAGGAMHPRAWRSIERYIDDDIRANRERADDAALRDAAPPRPSLIRVGRRWWHDAAAKVALYVALVRAGLR